MDYILNKASLILCTLMGKVGPQIQNPRVVPSRVKVVGQPILTEIDLYPVSGCAPPGGAPPCTLMSQWIITTLRVKSGGKRVLHQSSLGLCPTSGHTTTTINALQIRVKGT